MSNDALRCCTFSYYYTVGIFIMYNKVAHSSTSIVLQKRTACLRGISLYRKKIKHIVTDFKVFISTFRFPAFGVWVGWVLINNEKK